MHGGTGTRAGERAVAPLDLSAEHALVGERVEAAVLAVLRSGRHVGGPEVEALERDFAALCAAPHGVAVSSGTEALILALKALGVGPGTSVVTSPFTFFASAGSIAWLGARPLLCDVDPDTALVTPEAAAAALEPDTRCLLPVHLYGQMADVRGFRRLADAHGLALVEDAAQAHGARRDGARAGELGDATAFSFYPTKNLGTAGEGGLVTTPRAAVADALRALRDHGSREKYRHEIVGTNGRLNAISAAVLNAKLPWLERWNARRRELAARYDRALSGSDLVRPLARAPGAEHVFHQYTVRVPAALRESVRTRLAAHGITVGVHYPSPVHLQPAAAGWGYGPGDFPRAEALAREVLCLPVHPFLEDGDADRVAHELRAAVEAG